MTSRQRRGLRLAKGASNKPALPYFRVGEPILESGIYRIFHSEHRLSHEVTLIAGEIFPRCSVCRDDVHFELLKSALHTSRDRELSGLRLYEVPHPEETEADDPDKIVA